MPATKRQVDVSGATFSRFEGDRIVEEFVTWDPRALLTALGIISVGQDTDRHDKEHPEYHAARPDLDTMKQVNRQFVTGVTVVTAMDDGKPRGLAVNAFSSVSLDPPTVMVAVQRTSSTHECLFRAQHLAINILSTDQLDVVGVFATKTEDKFAGWTGSRDRSAAR